MYISNEIMNKLPDYGMIIFMTCYIWCSTVQYYIYIALCLQIYTIIKIEQTWRTNIPEDHYYEII